jgi:hypothetical protein
MLGYKPCGTEELLFSEIYFMHKITVFWDVTSCSMVDEIDVLKEPDAFIFQGSGTESTQPREDNWGATRMKK